MHRSLNLGWTVGDKPDHVRANFDRLSEAAAFDLAYLHTVSQVHGECVVEVQGRAPETAQTHGVADALWTRDAAAVVGVKTADCIPLLIAAPDIGGVAAVHSGWRGTFARIARAAVRTLAEQGAEPRKMIAAIGPSIRRCCYEVSPELAEQFRHRFGSRAVDAAPGKQPHLDLVFVVASTLMSAGIPCGQLETLDACTSCAEDRFFSHRRDAASHAGQKGLHLSFAQPRFA